MIANNGLTKGPVSPSMDPAKIFPGYNKAGRGVEGRRTTFHDEAVDVEHTYSAGRCLDLHLPFLLYMQPSPQVRHVLEFGVHSGVRKFAFGCPWG